MPTKMKPLPTLEALKASLHYNPETGEFTRLSNMSPAGFIYTRRDGERSDIRIKVSGVSYLAHRLAWMYYTGCDPMDMEIDHKNGNSIDNRFENLRKVKRVINCRNAKKRKDNKTGITGVCFDISNKRYLVQIGTDKGRRKKLVCDFFEACCLRKSWEREIKTYSSRHGV
ncbi:HNH endonuclease [Vibrio phage K165]|nr:putative HNHc domain-containing protein [Vibrio phage 12E28.1]QZI90193.1 putative HNHc domain-containing protein [Vibrio phage 18E29.1]QZI90558.1 putative HNHc domain-containing protein [Vibrio phage 91E28.1a]QZI90692.1 putative HNHc domain-containing protein [Vibrio phage 98E28.6a]